MRPLTIQIVTPAPKGSRKGNRVTAVRWAKLLRELGHRVRLTEALDENPCDVLIALHARKSHPAIVESKQKHPTRPVIVVLTGTDLYGDIQQDANAQQSLELASKLIILQSMGMEELPPHHHAKTHVIYQSVQPPTDLPTPRDDIFEVCSIGHMREVKDPFRLPEACRLLPNESQIHAIQLGSALTEEMAQRAEQEQRDNPRYDWLGELPWSETLKKLAQCRLLVLTSRSEGGANAVCEALACGVPVISSEIAGSIGILGKDYPGYYPFGDTEALATLLHRAETDAAFLESLRKHCEEKRSLVDPETEKDKWRQLLNEILSQESP